MNSQLEILSSSPLKPSDTFLVIEKKIVDESDYIILSETLSNISLKENDKDVSI